MNLVAKEFVAAQDEENPGVLILSQFAGAAEELSEALIVNPYNIQEMATAIETAASMPLRERQARHGQLLAKIKRSSSDAWARRFIQRLRDGPADPALFRLDRGPLTAAMDSLALSQSGAESVSPQNSTRRQPAVGVRRVH